MKSNLRKFFEVLVILVIFILIILLITSFSYFGGKDSLETEEESFLCDCDDLFGNPTKTGLLWKQIVSVFIDTKLFGTFLSIAITTFGVIVFGGSTNVGEQGIRWWERVKSAMRAGLLFLLVYVFFVTVTVVLWYLGVIPLFSYTPKPEAVVCQAIQQGQDFEYSFFEGFSYIERRYDDIYPHLRTVLSEKCEKRDRECYFFLTGQSGVGKSTFLKKFLEELEGGYLYLNFKLVNVADTNKYLRTNVGLDIDFPEEDVWSVIEKVLNKCPKTVVVVEDLVRAEDDFVDDRLRIAYGLYRLHEKGVPIIFSSSNPDLMYRLQKTGRMYDLKDSYELDVIHDDAFRNSEVYKKLEERTKFAFDKSLEMTGGFFKDLKLAFELSRRRIHTSKEINQNLLEDLIEQDLAQMEKEFCENHVIREIGFSRERDSDIPNFGYLLWGDFRRTSYSSKCGYKSPDFVEEGFNPKLVLFEFFRGRYASLNLVNEGMKDHCFYFSTRLVGRVLNGDICRRSYCSEFPESEFCDGEEFKL